MLRAFSDRFCLHRFQYVIFLPFFSFFLRPQTKIQKTRPWKCINNDVFLAFSFTPFTFFFIVFLLFGELRAWGQPRQVFSVFRPFSYRFQTVFVCMHLPWWAFFTRFLIPFFETTVWDHFLRPLFWDHFLRPFFETIFWDHCLRGGAPEKAPKTKKEPQNTKQLFGSERP